MREALLCSDRLCVPSTAVIVQLYFAHGTFVYVMHMNLYIVAIMQNCRNAKKNNCGSTTVLHNSDDMHIAQPRKAYAGVELAISNPHTSALSTELLRQCKLKPQTITHLQGIISDS